MTPPQPSTSPAPTELSPNDARAASGIRAGVVVFPGSNCDDDAVHALKLTLAAAGAAAPVVEKLWHATPFEDDLDLVVLPGGFSYGDYLRTGAIAARAPVMRSVQRLADAGRLVLGICNGFQILVECGLLPGALLVNRSLRFHCRDVHLKVENSGTPFTQRYGAGEVIQLPVAHGMGNYFADEATLDELERAGRVVLRYCHADGTVDRAASFNGSARSIAGIVSASGTVMGLMPHPERNAELCLGSGDGARMFESVAAWVRAHRSGFAASPGGLAAAGEVPR